MNAMITKTPVKYLVGRRVQETGTGDRGIVSDVTTDTFGTLITVHFPNSERLDQTYDLRAFRTTFAEMDRLEVKR